MSFLESYYRFFDMVIAAFLGATASKITEQPNPQQSYSVLLFFVIAAILFVAVRTPSIIEYLAKKILEKKKKKR